MDSEHWSLAQMEQYFSGDLPDDETTGELLDHLADCPVCFKIAGEYAGRLKEEYLSGEEAQDAIAVQSMALLRSAAESELDSEVAGRLRNWVGRGKAWAAVQLEVAKDAISSGYVSVAGLAGADALRLVEAHAGTATPVRARGAVRTRGAANASPSEPRTAGAAVVVEPSRDGRGISIRCSAFPGMAEPLIALLPLAEGKAHIRRLEPEPSGAWVVRFRNVPEGGYLLLVEEMGPNVQS